MSDNYALDKQMERLQQEVAELRGDVAELRGANNAVTAIVRDALGQLAALERPAAATADPVCECGHEKGVHGPNGCYKPNYAGPSVYCPCQAFTPAQPAPAEGIDVERVMALVKQYGEELSDMSFFKETDPEKLGYFDYHEEIAEKLFAEIRAMLGGAR